MLVEIYTKPDCHLCDEAKEVLHRLRARVPFPLREINIQDDPELFERYKNDIPVVFVDGRRAFKYRVNERRLEARLRQG